MYVPTNIDIQRGFDANLIMNDVDLNTFKPDNCEIAAKTSDSGPQF